MYNILVCVSILGLVIVTGIITIAHNHTPKIISIGSVSDNLSVENIDNITSIVFVGDIMLARHVETLSDRHGSHYVYSNLPKISKTTALVGNFEATIPETHVHTPNYTFAFSVDKQHIPALYKYGFTHLSLANNHSFDFGKRGLLNTRLQLENNALNWFGDSIIVDMTSVWYIELDEMTIAIVGLNNIGHSLNMLEVETIIKTASQNSDYQIVYIHWGVEYAPRNSISQQKIAHQLIKFGADSIIGHHPHVVQNIEFYKGVPIFYSLGNFIFDQYFSREVQEGLWIELVSEDGILTYKLQGITSTGSHSSPRFMSYYQNDIFLTNLSKKSTPTLQDMILTGYIIQQHE